MKGRWQLLWLVLAIMVLSTTWVSAQEKVLRVGLTSAGDIEFFEEVMKPKFEALYPDVRLVFENIGWSHDQYIINYIAGTAVDVFQAGSDSYGQRIDMQAPFDEFIRRSGWEENLNDFPPAMMQSLIFDGQIYGLPYSYATRTFSYRMDWFDEAGLDRNQPPTTWDELVEYGRQLTRIDSDGNFERQGFVMDPHYIRFSPFLFQAGGRWMSSDLTRYTVADEPGIEAATFLRGLFHESRISDPTRGAKNFTNGGSAMAYEGPGVWQPGVANYDPADVGVAMPLAYREQTQWGSMNIWSITNTSPYQQEAWNWIEFMLDMENLVESAAALGHIPGRVSAVTHSPWADDPRWHTTFEAISIATPIDIQSPFMSEIRRNDAHVIPALHQIFYEGASPLILQEVQRQANVWLAEQLAR